MPAFESNIIPVQSAVLSPAPAKPLVTLAMGRRQCTGHLLCVFQQPGLLQLLFPAQNPSLPDAARQRQPEVKHHSSDKPYLLLQLEGESSRRDPVVTDVVGVVARG